MVEVSGMGFKDLPGAKLAQQNQSASDKSSQQQASASSNLSKQDSLANTKSSQ
jgi:hypothetical protein